MVLASSSLQSGTTSERSSALLRALAEDILRRWGACASGTIENRGDHTGFPTALLAEGVPALLHFLVNELARSPSDDGRQFLSQWVEAVHEAGFGSEDVLNTLRVLKRSAAEVIAEVEGVPDDVTGTATRMLSDRLDETTVEISELLEQAAEREAAESQRELRQLGAIAQITAAAVSSLDVRRVFEAVAPQLPRLFKFDRLILGLVTSSGDALRLAAVWPPAEALREGTVLPLRQSALGHPILDHGPFIVSDVEKAPAFAERDLLLSDGIRSLIAMPLLARDKPLGALCLLSRAPAAYSTSDIAALRGVAGQLTTAFVCADLLDTERKRSAELHVVNEVAKKALTAADVGDILQAVTASIQKHFAYYDVSLFLLEAERRELALAAGAGAYSRSLSPGYRQPLGVGVIGLVAQSGESLMINDVTKEPRRVLAFPGETTTGSELCVPIKLRGEVLGVINVECERTDAFDQDDLTAMETIADEIAQVVETVRLRAGQRRDHYEADQARRRLEYLCRHAPFGVCTMDLQGVYTHWSEGCERLLGLSASEMIGQKTPAAHIKPPYDLVSDLAQCTRECSTETERAMTRKDGREIIVLDGRVSLYDEDGRHVGFTSYLQDITERKRVEERIRREEKKLHDIVDAIGAGLSLINDRMEVVWVNRALSDWFALRWESIGRRCHEIYRESATPCPDCPAARSFRSGSVHSTEQTLLRPNGQRRYFQHITAPIKDDTGAVRHVLKFTQDITEHAQRVHQLTLLRQLGEAMSGTLDLDRLLHLVLTCVTAGHALGLNRALLLLANESGAALEGKMAVGPLSWADAARIWRELSAQFASLEDFLADYLRKTEHGPMPFQDVMSELVFPVGGESEGVVAQSVRDGKPIVVRDAISDPRVGEKLRAILATPEFVCVPLVAKGRPLGAIIADNLYSGAPITDEHVQLLAMFAAQAALAIENAKAYEKLEDQMRQTREAQDRLLRSERLATVGEMAAHVAHEIRNPLVTIGGFARIILRALDETSPQVAHAKIIVEEVLRLENILKNVMDFTKPSAPQKTQADINRILEDTCDLALSQASATGIALSKSLDPRAARLNADPAQMKQALLNIIRNAVESMDAGGRLALQTQADTRTVTVVISDTGKGIPPEDLNRIFDPFFTTKPQGTGLGLAVTRKIIEDHGGEIRVASAVGQGTTFTITLPR